MSPFGILVSRSRSLSDLPLSRSSQGPKGSLSEMRAGCFLGKSADFVSVADGRLLLPAEPCGISSPWSAPSHPFSLLASSHLPRTLQPTLRPPAPPTSPLPPLASTLCPSVLPALPSVPPSCSLSNALSVPPSLPSVRARHHTLGYRGYNSKQKLLPSWNLHSPGERRNKSKANYVT